MTAPVANERILIEYDVISYLHDSEHLPAAEFDPLEFLAALPVHIPDKWEQLVHYYGHFSSRARGARKKKSAPTPPPIPPLPDPDEQHAASKSWAALIKRIYECDPLLCPRCGERMKIVAFLHDPAEIKKIMESLGLPHFRAPPKIMAAGSAEPSLLPLDDAA